MDKMFEQYAKKPEEVQEEKTEKTVEKTEVEKTDVVEKTEKTEEKQEAPTLTLDSVLDYVNSNDETKYEFLSKVTGREIKSSEDLIEKQEIEKVVEKEPDLPEDIKDILDFKLKHGRTVEDYIKAKQDWKQFPAETTIGEYLRQDKGYSEEDAKRYLDVYKVQKLDPDDVGEAEAKRSEQEAIKAEFALKDLHNEALRYFEAQQKDLHSPSKDVLERREAEDKEKEQRLMFAEGVKSAAKGLEKIQVGDDFEFAISDMDKFTESIESPEKILNRYDSNEGFKYDELARELYIGRNFSKILAAYADAKVAKHVEDNAGELENSKGNPIAEVKGGEDIKAEVQKLFNSLM